MVHINNDLMACHAYVGVEGRQYGLNQTHILNSFLQIAVLQQSCSKKIL